MKWTSVKEKRPMASGEYIVSKDGFVFAAEYSKEVDMFFGKFNDNLKADFWMPLPELPKEGQYGD